MREQPPTASSQYPRSLRVASKCGACGVALLAKGTTLGFVPQGDFPLKGDRDLRGVARLAVIRIWRQRVSCDECQQALGLTRLVPLLHREHGGLDARGEVELRQDVAH